MPQSSAATAVVFPFDTFGNSGTGDGARLLGDVLREAIDDTLAEPRPTRPHAFADTLEVVEFPFDTMEQVRDWRTTGRKAVREALAANAFTLWLSGNHLGVLPVYEELTARDLVIQFDAHLDCYDLHDTTDTLSPGNFLLHAESLPTVVNVGTRDLFLLPKDMRRAYRQVLPAETLSFYPGGTLMTLAELTKKAKRVWIDVDADVFDPAFAPAVHHPSPFGLTLREFQTLLDAAWSGKVVGLSLSEFDPGRDVRDQTLNLLGWLLERVLLKKFE